MSGISARQQTCLFFIAFLLQLRSDGSIYKAPLAAAFNSFLISLFHTKSMTYGVNELGRQDHTTGTEEPLTNPNNVCAGGSVGLVRVCSCFDCFTLFQFSACCCPAIFGYQIMLYIVKHSHPQQTSNIYIEVFLNPFCL